MAREITNRAELNRRRELMRVAIEKRAAERLAASQRVIPAAPPAAVALHTTAASSMATAGATPAASVRPGRTHAVKMWLQANAAEHKMRFEEAADNRGRRMWNIDCDACGTQLSMVGEFGRLEQHLKSAKHVNALSAGEDPATRVVLPRTKRHNVDAWLQAHAVEHRMRFAEAVSDGGKRVWNIDCDACGTKLSGVAGIQRLELHAKTTKHVNALSATSSIALIKGSTQRKRPRA
jgi:hypothetical protein